MEETKANTFEKYGKTWVKWSPGDPFPAELAAADPDTAWWYINQRGQEIRAGITLLKACWRQDSAIRAWRIDERSKPKAATEPEADTFEKDGYRWTRCNPTEQCPERLKKRAAGTWWRMDYAGCVIKSTLKSEASEYWSTPRSKYDAVHAFCIPDEDKIDPALANIKEAVKSADVSSSMKKQKDEPPSASDVAASCSTNAAMIERDGKPEDPKAKHERLVAQLVGNGNIFAPPKREVHPLYRVSPITTTGGLMLWGAEHGNQ